jgi:hypothetical protein
MVNWSNVHSEVLTASAIPRGIQAKCANTRHLSWIHAVTTNVFNFDTKRVLMWRDQKLPVSFNDISKNTKWYAQKD